VNWVDLVIISLLIFFALDAWNKSFLGEVFDFITFLLAFFLSFRFYNLAGSFFEKNFNLPHSLALILGFTAIWFLVEIVLLGLLQLLIPRLNKLRVVDHKLQPLALVPAIFRGLIFIAIILIIVGIFPIQPGIKSAVNKSLLGSFILDKTQQLDTPLKSVFGDLSNDTLSFFTIKPKSDESLDLGFKTSNFEPDEVLESKMINLVNQERTSRGLNALTFSPKLRNLGRLHSGDMFQRGYFSHFSPEGKTVADRAKENNVDYLIIGENLAYAPNLDLAHKGLMNSEGHRANILSPEYNQIGIGILDGGVYGLMITQVFSN
jgi:hypothetical protein